MAKIACVTGANKGIGFDVVRLLCQKLKPAEGWKVLLASRSAERGQKALETLLAEKLPISPVYVQLDITDKNQCEALRDRLSREYGGLDLLVNNAAIAYKRSSTVPLLEQAQKTLVTNYFGTKQVTEALLLVLRDNARVISVASTEAERAYRNMDASLRQKMLSPDLTIPELDEMAQQFIEDARQGKDIGELTSYGFSKWNFSLSGDPQQAAA